MLFGGGPWPGKLCVGHHFGTALKGEGAKKRNTAEGGTKVGATNADIQRQHRGGEAGRRHFGATQRARTEGRLAEARAAEKRARGKE